MALFALFLILLFGYSLLSRRIEGSWVTPPMLFSGGGLIVALCLDIPVGADRGIEPFLKVAEIALVLLLFCDASKVNLGLLRKEKSLPFRLLGPAMLSTMALGTLGAALIFPALDWWEAALLATILAPTDASLGQVIVRSKVVPERIREALDVEAGLNDGLSVPFLLFFVTAAAVETEGASPSLLGLIFEQIGYGVLIGVLIGFIGGRLLHWGSVAQTLDRIHKPLAVVVLPIFAWVVAEPIGGSAFIASYVAGLSTRAAFREIEEGSTAFADEWGESLSFAVFFLFGMFAGSPDSGICVATLFFGLLVLTVFRILPVYATLGGTGLRSREKIFIGWFGPKGLASIVLGLVFLESETRLPGESIITACVISTVLLSIFLHGLSAKPGEKWLQKSGEAGP